MSSDACLKETPKERQVQPIVARPDSAFGVLPEED